MAVLSIDIGSSHMTVVEGTGKKDNVTIVRAATAALPVDSVLDGSIRNPGELIDAARGIVSGLGFKSKKAIVTINVNNMLIRDFTLPDANPKQLSGMVSNEMLTNYSTSPSDVIQFVKQAVTLGEKGEKTAHIRAATMKREIVDGYHQLLDAIGLRPVALDFHANAISKLLGSDASINGMNLDGKIYLMVDFGSSGTLVHAVADKKLFASRYIPLGVNDLDNMISDREFIHLEKAKEFRQEKMDLLSEESENGDLMKHARAFLMQWSDELQKVTKFFLSRKGAGSVDNAFIYGMGAQIKGLDGYMAASLGIESQKLKTISTLKFTGDSGADKISNCLNAAGALIRL